MNARTALAAALLLRLSLPAPARAQEAPRGLTLREAMDLAVERNLTARLAAARTEEARGRVLRESAALLPHLMGTASQGRTLRMNLAAMGFTASAFPGVPSLLGPFNVFDARATLAADILNWNAVQKSRAARASADSAELEERLAREQVAATAALAYIDALRTRQEIEAARADHDLAVELLRLAADSKTAGTAAGIDVARARTQESAADVRLLDARTRADDAEIRVKRVCVLPLDEPLELRDDLHFSSSPVLSADEAVAQALARRLEPRIAQSRVRSLDLALSAARGERLPVLSVRADEGLSGALPADSRLTGSLGAGVQVPLFAGGRIAGEVRSAGAARDMAQAALEDARLQVEEDARLSVQDLRTAVQRVEAARRTVTLALDELAQARDRFAAGVGDNVELVVAQSSLAKARADRIEALAGLAQARLNLALAFGQAVSFDL